MKTKSIDRPSLTDRQAERLAVIRRHWIDHGCSPTTRYICGQMGMSGSPEAAKAHLRPLVRKGYLRAVEGHRSGATSAAGKGPRTLVLTDTEIVVKLKGKRVRVALTGPMVEMTLAEVVGGDLNRRDTLVILLIVGPTLLQLVVLRQTSPRLPQRRAPLRYKQN